MRRRIGSALVQIMACRLFGAKPLSELCWVNVIWTLRNKLQWNCNQNMKLFIHENASENIVCEMAAILSRKRWVKFRVWMSNYIPHFYIGVINYPYLNLSTGLADLYKQMGPSGFLLLKGLSIPALSSLWGYVIVFTKNRKMGFNYTSLLWLQCN